MEKFNVLCRKSCFLAWETFSVQNMPCHFPCNPPHTPFLAQNKQTVKIPLYLFRILLLRFHNTEESHFHLLFEYFQTFFPFFVWSAHLQSHSFPLCRIYIFIHTSGPPWIAAISCHARDVYPQHTNLFCSYIVWERLVSSSWQQLDSALDNRGRECWHK